MTSMIIRTALLINTTSRLTRDTPINKPPENKTQRISRVADDAMPILTRQDRPISSYNGNLGELHYYKQLDDRNRQCRELSGAFRARL